MVTLKLYIWFVLCGLGLMLLAACGGPPPPNVITAPSTSAGEQTAPPLNMVNPQPDLQIVSGQALYIPAYSEVFLGSVNSTMGLSVTLAIHNTDIQHPIIVRSVRYYDTNGALIREYLSEALTVAPLATTGFIVEESDKSAGWGANFIVEWSANTPVYEPIVEAIMVSTQGTHGLSMISQGRVLSQIAPLVIPMTAAPTALAATPTRAVP